jgi:hypothetical protein
MTYHRLTLLLAGLLLLGALGLIKAPGLDVRSASRPAAHASAATAPLTDLEEIVLQQAAQALGCSSPVTVNGTRYQVTCVVFPGHINDARIERYADAAAAFAAFQQASSSGTLTQFHGFAAYARKYVQNPGPGLPMNHRYHGWQVERWLILSHAFDDTHFLFAYRPETVSEAIYQAAVEHGLFPPGVSSQGYLPLIIQFRSTTPTPTPTPTWTPTSTPTATPTSLTPLPDLLVDWMGITLETGGSCAYTSTTLGMRVHFSNVGAAPAGPFVLDVNGTQRSFGGLPNGQSLSTWLPGSYLWPGTNTSIVDATNLVQESNEDNNRLSQFLPIPTLPPTCTATGTPTPTGTYTPTPTPSPWPTGDLWWTRQVHVYDAAAGSQTGIPGAQVHASALSSSNCTTDQNGDCTVTVHAHDTGSVYISVTAAGFRPFGSMYPGMPPWATLSVGLERQ